MLESILLLIFLSFCVGTGVWLFFLATVKRGDFEDIEGAKYRMLEDDDLESNSNPSSPGDKDR